MKSNKLIHKKEQIFKMERDNVFAEKISLITNDYKRMQLIHLLEHIEIERVKIY